MPGGMTEVADFDMPAAVEAEFVYLLGAVASVSVRNKETVSDAALAKGKTPDAHTSL